MKLIPRLSFLLLAASLMGCGARTASLGADGAVVPVSDSSVSKPPPVRDAAWVVDAAPTGPLLQAVLNDLQLPRRGSDYARDVDGDGRPDNALGSLMGMITSFVPLPLDELVGQLFSGGAGFIVFEVHAGSFDFSPAAEVRVGLGLDMDDDPNNNFSGSGTFGLSPEAPHFSSMYGGVRDNQLGAEGELIIPLTPYAGTPLLLSNAFLFAEAFDERGLYGGVINGAIPWETVQEVLLPALAEGLNQGGLSPQILQILDSNRDGRISADELQSNPLVGAVFRPDVDLDGDGRNDAFSVGFGFTAVRCRLIY